MITRSAFLDVPVVSPDDNDLITLSDSPAGVIYLDSHDIDEDADNDLLVQLDNQLFLLENKVFNSPLKRNSAKLSDNRNVSFDQTLIYTSPLQSNERFRVQVLDLNGDTFLDIRVVHDDGNSVEQAFLLYNSDTNTYDQSIPSPLPDPGSSFEVDLNKDGKPDLIGDFVPDNGGVTLSWWANQSDQMLAFQEKLFTGDQLTSVTEAVKVVGVANFTGSDAEDFLVQAQGPGVSELYVFEQLETEIESSLPDIPLKAHPIDIPDWDNWNVEDISDFDRDELQELLVSRYDSDSNTEEVFLLNIDGLTGGSRHDAFLIPFQGNTFVRFQDIDTDADYDIVVKTDDSIQIRENNRGVFSNPLFDTDDLIIESAQILSDLDMDGDADAIGCRLEDSTIFWKKNEELVVGQDLTRTKSSWTFSKTDNEPWFSSKGISGEDLDIGGLLIDLGPDAEGVAFWESEPFRLGSNDFNIVKTQWNYRLVSPLTAEEVKTGLREDALRFRMNEQTHDEAHMLVVQGVSATTRTLSVDHYVAINDVNQQHRLNFDAYHTAPVEESSEYLLEFIGARFIEMKTGFTEVTSWDFTGGNQEDWIRFGEDGEFLTSPTLTVDSDGLSIVSSDDQVTSPNVVFGSWAFEGPQAMDSPKEIIIEDDTLYQIEFEVGSNAMMPIVEEPAEDAPEEEETVITLPELFAGDTPTFRFRASDIEYDRSTVSNFESAQNFNEYFPPNDLPYLDHPKTYITYYLGTSETAGRQLYLYFDYLIAEYHKNNPDIKLSLRKVTVRSAKIDP